MAESDGVEHLAPHNGVCVGNLGALSRLGCIFPFNSQVLHRASTEFHYKFDIVQQCIPNSYLKQKARVKRHRNFSKEDKSLFNILALLLLCMGMSLKAYYRAAPNRSQWLKWKMKI